MNIRGALLACLLQDLNSINIVAFSRICLENGIIITFVFLKEKNKWKNTK